MRYGLSKPQILEARTALPASLSKAPGAVGKNTDLLSPLPEAAALRNAKQLLKLTKKGSEPLIVEVGRARLEAGQQQESGIRTWTQ